MTAQKVLETLKAKADFERLPVLSSFFKSGVGGYAEGDVFIGVDVPTQRKIAKEFAELDLKEIKTLLGSEIHEARLTALFILVLHFQKAESEQKKQLLVDFYLDNLERVNNWDLVDSSSYQILGSYLADKKDREILYQLARKNHLWSQRVAIISTYAFIKNRDFEDTFGLAEILLDHKHDLIHKAVGWMLREVGKKDREAEEEFLQQHYRQMPRTMLRYAIERFDKPKRSMYLKSLI